MESKLPKPSGLKQPGASLKPMVPSERIRTSAIPSFNSKPLNTSLGSATTSRTTNYAPLSRNLVNIPENFSGRGRAASPDSKSTLTLPNRMKMRRSRSACDLRDVGTLKRAENGLFKPTVPAKFPRDESTNNLSESTAARNASRPTQRPSANAINVPLKRLGTNVQKSKPSAAVTKVNTSSSAAAATVSRPKGTAGKRIPPYDFKARFNDLLEKHKILKEKYEEKCDQFGNLENLPEQLEETEANLIKTREQLKNAQTESECLHRQVDSQSQKIDTLTSSLTLSQQSLEELRKSFTVLKSEHDMFSKDLVDYREKNKELMERNATLEEELTICKEKLFQSNLERKELHNKVMDLRGNIRVFCRIRPPLSTEKDKPLCGWNYIDESSIEIQNLDATLSNKQNAHTFSFDQVFHPNSTQEDIFEMVSPMIQSALDGYNVCIFAYGQTGSGKTFTMDGIASNVGVIPRTVDLLFESINNYRLLGWEYEIKVTFLEIYNEVLYDLLSNEPKDMEIRMSKQNKNEIYVSNITEETVHTANHLRELMQYAKQNRATASTAGNERSSRSHAVTRMELKGIHKEKNEISIGTINLVDLAGSESPKTSTRMTETKNINRSLSELTNVILALLQKQDHIPYRNSKLTHLLMPSLGGNSKTLMFINVAPFQDCFVESVKSLRFAATVNSCKMTKAKRTRFLNSSMSSRGDSLDKYAL